MRGYFKEKFVSDDNNIEIEYFCNDSDSWINLNNIKKLFKDNKIFFKPIKKYLEFLEEQDQIEINYFHIAGEYGDSKKSKYYNLFCLRKIEKNFSCQYLKEFIKSAKKNILKSYFYITLIHSLLFKIKTKGLINILIFITFPILSGILYFILNKNKNLLNDFSLNLISINFAIISFNISSLVAVIKSANKENRKHVNSKNTIDRLFVLASQTDSRSLINEMRISIVSVILVTVLILIFNFSLIINNMLSTFITIQSLIFLLQLINNIYMEQKNLINEWGDHFKIGVNEIEKDIKRHID